VLLYCSIGISLVVPYPTKTTSTHNTPPVHPTPQQASSPTCLCSSCWQFGPCGVWCKHHVLNVTDVFSSVWPRRRLISRSPGRSMRFSSVQSHFFLSPIGGRTLKMPVPYPPPNLGAYTRTPSHNHPCSAVGAHIISLRLDDLVVPKLPACGCE